MLIKIAITTLLLGYACQAAPTTYDQRQDGDVNVKVDLDNFVVLIARPVSALDVFGAVGQLLADSKNAQLARHPLAEPKVESEAKSAVVEPEQSRVAVALEVEPNQQQQQQQQQQPAQPEASQPEPAPVLVQQQQQQQQQLLQFEIDKAARSLELPVLRPKNRDNKEKSIGNYKFVEAVEEPQSLKLVGDSIENCGPGRSRDRLGICQEDQ